MTVMSSICEENIAIQKELEKFIAEYDHMPDEQRMHNIGYILDLVHHTLESKLNHIIPIAKQKDNLTQWVKISETRYKSVEDILDKMINIHVDEPDAEFKARAEQLLNLFTEQVTLENTMLIPQLETELTTGEQEQLGRYLISRFNEAPSVLPKGNDFIQTGAKE